MSKPIDCESTPRPTHTGALCAEFSATAGGKARHAFGTTRRPRRRLAKACDKNASSRVFFTTDATNVPKIVPITLHEIPRAILTPNTMPEDDIITLASGGEAVFIGR
jgi:hypothetical protein